MRDKAYNSDKENKWANQNGWHYIGQVQKFFSGYEGFTLSKYMNNIGL